MYGRKHILHFAKVHSIRVAGAGQAQGGLHSAENRQNHQSPAEGHQADCLVCQRGELIHMNRVVRTTSFRGCEPQKPHRPQTMLPSMPPESW
jgi:hypothetical protein